MVGDAGDAGGVGYTEDASDSGGAGDACMATSVQTDSPTKFMEDIGLFQRLKSMLRLPAGQPTFSPGGESSVRTKFFVHEQVCPICTDPCSLLGDIVNATLIAPVRSNEFR